MSDTNTINAVKNYGLTFAQGSCPAGLFLYTKPGTWKVNIGTVDGDVAGSATNKVALVDPVNGITLIDLTNASYDGHGEFQDHVNTLAGWVYLRQGSTRARMLYSSNLKINTLATTTGTDAGVGITWNSTNSLHLGISGGAPGDNSQVAAVRLKPEGNLPFYRRPTDAEYQRYVSAKASILKAASTVPVYGSGTMTLNLYRSSKDADVLIDTKPCEATTVRTDVDVPTDGYEFGLGEWPTLEIVGSAAQAANGTISMYSGYGEKG